MVIMSVIACDLSSDEMNTIEETQRFITSQPLCPPRSFSPIMSGERELRERRVEFSDIEEAKRLSVCDERRESDLTRFFRSSRSSSPSVSSFSACKRSQQPRLSLLGKPMIYRSIRPRDPRYRIYQNRLYNFLERPRGFTLLYHLSL